MTDRNRGFFSDLGTKCVTTKDCLKDLVCKGVCSGTNPQDCRYACSTACASDGDCKGGTFCLEYSGGSKFCMPPGPAKLGEACKYRSDCESTLCIANVCVQPCVDDDCQCPIGTRCQPLASGSHKPAYCAKGVSTCVRCGDGMIGGSEVCDDGERNDDYVPDRCRTDCKPARCGDGVVDTGEECDNGDNSTGCKAPCPVVEPPQTTSGPLEDGADETGGAEKGADETGEAEKVEGKPAVDSGGCAMTTGGGNGVYGIAWAVALLAAAATRRRIRASR